MMKSKEFIIQRLNKFASSFPELKLRYEFNQNTVTHIIEVKPLHIYESNEDYLRAEDEFEEEFEKLYPSEEIIFISEGSLTEIKNPEHEIGYGLVSLGVDMDDIFEPIFFTTGYNLTCVEVAGNNYALAA
jgi:hypothetical protein